MTNDEKQVNQACAGKTIKKIIVQAVNVWRIEFEDGSGAELWADTAIPTEHGNIPGIFLGGEEDK